MFFLHAIMSRLQEESKAKEDASVEKTMSVLGRIPSQEMKSTSIMRTVGKALSEMNLLNPARELGMVMRHSFIRRD